MPSTASSARSRSANCGRHWPAPRSRPYELTFWPSSVISRDAVGGELLDLVDDVAHAPADLGAAHDGHDAERARVVAPDLDGDPRASGRPRARAGSADGYASCSSRISTTGPSARALVEQRGRVGEVVGAEHDVDVAGPLDDQLAVLLGQAAADRDLQVGPAVLQRLEVPEVAVELVVGVLADAAGVEHHDVGRLEVVGRLHALGREQPGDALGVVLVHLAPEGAHVEATGHDGRVLRAGRRIRPDRHGPLVDRPVALVAVGVEHRRAAARARAIVRSPCRAVGGARPRCARRCTGAGVDAPRRSAVVA